MAQKTTANYNIYLIFCPDINVFDFGNPMLVTTSMRLIRLISDFGFVILFTPFTLLSPVLPSSPSPPHLPSTPLLLGVQATGLGLEDNYT